MISLDQYKVADREINQIISLVKAALAWVAIVVLSFILENSLDEHGSRAINFWQFALASCSQCTFRPLPIIIAAKPLGRLGKLAALRYIRNRLYWNHNYSTFES